MKIKKPNLILLNRIKKYKQNLIDQRNYNLKILNNCNPNLIDLYNYKIITLQDNINSIDHLISETKQTSLNGD